MDDQKDLINQAMNRLGIGIVLFYLLLFGSLAQLGSMNNDLTKLLRRLSSLKCGLVAIYANDGDCIEPINEGYGYKALKEAVNAVELSEIIVRNTSGTQTAWFLISSGEEGIIDQSGIIY